ncbi:MAG: TIM barrel protein [Phycisphaerae bacterium]|nr:TIM barrel protein [Tepidisphaeraceae bacterium]
MPAQPSSYKFSFGPWNISEGADPFGPPVRASIPWGEKLKTFKRLGFDAVMFHDDDIVPSIEEKQWPQIERECNQMRKALEGEGLVTELAAPRLWEDARTIDGAFTNNDPANRKWAIERSKRTADICRLMGTDILVLWLAREGTYAREAKPAIEAHKWLLDGINQILAHDNTIRIAIEPKPNEPMDQAYIPTIGHALALAERSTDPTRVGGLIETAHSLLAGLDPSDDMAFALSMNKLWSVHLNDQNGLKYDQDKAFGAANLRVAWNQVRVLEAANFSSIGMVAFDTKAMRTSKPEHALRHLENSRRIFLHLVEKVRTWDAAAEKQMVAARDYEALEMAVLEHLMGVKR